MKNTTKPVEPPQTKPKKAHRSYTEEDVEQALLQVAVHNGNISSAAKNCHVPMRTIYDWINGHGGKTGKYAKRYEDFCKIKKSEQDRHVSCLLQIAFRGMMDKLEEAKFKDFMILWGIAMDKLLAGSVIGTDAAQALDKILGYRDFMKGKIAVTPRVRS